jgi:hypothetical protein
VKELIKHAVVKDVKGFVVLGKCHADCFYKGDCIGLKMSKKSCDQGFFTNKGRYVDRKTAARIAKRSKQLDKTSKRKVSYLLSEDIWYQKSVVYCPIRGYLKVEA